MQNITNINANKNYNHVIKNLQDYMLDEANIKRSLEMKIESTNKNGSSIKEKDKFSKNTIEKSLKPSLFIPREKDTLFWCFYLMKHGDVNYEMLENKNILTEKKFKIEYVEKIRKEKQTVKTYKFATLTHIENNLVVNVLVAETLEIAELVTGGLCIPFDRTTEFIGIGMSYDPSTNKVIIPPKVEPTES